MKVTVELSDKEMEEIIRLTNEKRKGPAIRMLARDALNLRKREALRQKVMRGEWSIEFPDLKILRENRKP